MNLNNETNSSLVHECIDLALRQLNDEKRNLLLQYYTSAGGSEKIAQRTDLARKLGVSVETLRVRAFRIRADLETSIENCLEKLPRDESATQRTAELIPVIEQVRRLEPSLISHLKQHHDDLLKIDPVLFEHLFAEFLAAQSFDDVRLVGRNPNTSADIYAVKHLVGPDIPIRLFVEVKRWKRAIGIEVINQVLGAFIGERERFGWTAALIVTVGGFRDFEKWSREELALKGLFLKDRDDLLRYLEGYEQRSDGLWLPHPRTDL